MRRRETRIRVDPEDVRIAKGIANFKGVTMKDYFSKLIDKEAQEFQEIIKNNPAVYRRRK